MKFYIQIIIILVIFFKTETLLSENDLFTVNNIQIEKKDKTTNNALANQAIKKGFDQLIKRILLNEDKKKILDLNFSSIKELVSYYQVSNIPNKKKEKNDELLNFSVTFDKDKLHDLFFKRGIMYSEITDKDLFILPILTKDNEIFVFNNNYFYENWNKVSEDDLLEFILPIENIEIIQNINKNKNNLINLDINILFKEYLKKNLAVVFIEESKNKNEKIYIKAKLQEKNISKSLNIKKENLISKELNEKIITELKKELKNLVKAANLIDIRTPSFLNVKLNLNKKNNLVELNSRIKNIDSIENIYVQEFNKDTMNLRIKYLGKLEKIINQLKETNINLQIINDQWIIKTL